MEMQSEISVSYKERRLALPGIFKEPGSAFLALGNIAANSEKSDHLSSRQSVTSIPTK
jgi:hypothetical protein